MTRKRKPYLSVVADIDKRTNEKPFNGRTGSRVVDNPTVVGPDAVAKTISVTTSLRDDPLARLNARHQLRPHQYEAGVRIQALFDLAEPRSVAAMDFSREPVDGGGRSPEPINDAQMRAYDQLKSVRIALGARAFRLVYEVLSLRRFTEDIARERGITAERERRFVAFAFRDALDDAAELFGLKGQAPERREVRDKYFRAARSVHARAPAQTKEAA